MGKPFDVNADFVMMHVVRRRHTVSHRGRQDPARSNGAFLSVKKPMPPAGQSSAKQRIVRSVLPYDRTTNDRTTIAWPTNIQSRTPDGQFGPAKQRADWADCWFLATLAAVANDEQGRRILAGGIKQVTVDGIRGYAVTFQGLPKDTVFISNVELQRVLETDGGDADTRLMELAAAKFFNGDGKYKSLYIKISIERGCNQDEAEQCFRQYCQNRNIREPMKINPMFRSGSAVVAFFILTAASPNSTFSFSGDSRKGAEDAMRFLSQYATYDHNGASVVITGRENPMGNGPSARRLIVLWDAIRTDITADGTVNPQEVTFLNALDKWLKIRNTSNLMALTSASQNLALEHANPSDFTALLVQNQFAMSREQINLLRSGVQEVLAGGFGWIGFAGRHSGTIERIDPTSDTFTYSEPYHPTLVHTGQLSGLVQAILDETIMLTALKPATGKGEAESSHAGEKRGRHLLTFHHQAVKDGTIDPAESGPLAKLMAMDDGAFRHVYDSDHNGVIKGGELKAVQRRVDRWVNHLTLTPILS